MDQIRQGDVLLVRRRVTPKKLGEKTKRDSDGSLTLAHGEVTGHRHRFEAKSEVDLHQPASRSATAILAVRDRLTRLLHEEHAKIDIALAENEEEILYDMPMQVQETRKQIVRVED